MILAPAFIALVLSGCVSAHPVLDVNQTLPTATATSAPILTPDSVPSPSPTYEPAVTPASVFDLNGNYISGADHFKQYLSFRNVQVYEQEEDTFVDAIVSNDYPETIICAAGVAFYDENNELVAQGRLQTRDAQYILILPPGETTLFAQIDTDMTLTDLDFQIVFDDTLGVKPEE